MCCMFAKLVQKLWQLDPRQVFDAKAHSRTGSTILISILLNLCVSDECVFASKSWQGSSIQNVWTSNADMQSLAMS